MSVNGVGMQTLDDAAVWYAYVASHDAMSPTCTLARRTHLECFRIKVARLVNIEEWIGSAFLAWSCCRLLVVARMARTATTSLSRHPSHDRMSGVVTRLLWRSMAALRISVETFPRIGVVFFPSNGPEIFDSVAVASIPNVDDGVKSSWALAGRV